MEIATKPAVQKNSTLGKSRKKKAAPPPPVVQQAKAASYSGEVKTSPAKTKKKAKKMPQDEFMAFKVKVTK